MKKIVYLLFVLIFNHACADKKSMEDKIATPEKKSIAGSWKLVYADITENDSVQVKDLNNNDFIKIINETHFAFFNQDRGTDENYMAGAGTYTFNGEDYVETLDFIPAVDFRNHDFHFKVEIKGDTLVQHGHEKIEEAQLDRYILEKYIRIK